MRHQRAMLALAFASGLAGCTTQLPPDAGLLRRAEQESPGDGFSHVAFDGVLERFVRDGYVDYPGLLADRGELDAYYARLAARSPDSHPVLFAGRDAKLAYWINAYNASVLEAVLAYYPVDSVKDIEPPAGLFFLPRLAGFFYLQKITLGGVRYNLYDLENEVIRRRFEEPRIHFAINCASESCPRLPSRAFLPETLEAQLATEARNFIREPRNVEIDPEAGTITLSAIFDWFEDDFVEWTARSDGDRQAGLLDYIGPHLDAEQRAALALCADCRVGFFEYDWAINDQARQPAEGSAER
jgi:hypothetical protein